MILEYFLRLLIFFLEKVKSTQLISKNRKIIRNERSYSYSYVKKIVEYCFKNYDKIEELKNELKKDLDPLSKDIIDLILKRVNYIYTHNILDENILISPEEIKTARIIKTFLGDYKNKKKYSIKKFDSCLFYYNHGLMYVPKMVIDNLRNKDFIDGGAYMGYSAGMFEKKYKPKMIYSFEPESKNYNLLLKTIELNNLERTIPIQMGLGRNNSVMKIKYWKDASYITEDGTQEIRIITIDDFAIKNNLSVGLIKLDVEGYGLEVLNGAEKTIKQFKPVLLISIYHNGVELFEIKSYIQKLNPNYQIIIRKLVPLKPFTELTLIAWDKTN